MDKQRLKKNLRPCSKDRESNNANHGNLQEDKTTGSYSYPQEYLFPTGPASAPRAVNSNRECERVLGHFSEFIEDAA
jgi:hypothetical protein